MTKATIIDFFGFGFAQYFFSSEFDLGGAHYQKLLIK